MKNTRILPAQRPYAGGMRRNEVETALNAAVEQALGQVQSSKGYAIGSREELIAEFNRILLLQMESDSDLQVNILTANVEKGVLDVEVRENYRNILGKPEEVTCRKGEECKPEDLRAEEDLVFEAVFKG